VGIGRPTRQFVSAPSHRALNRGNAPEVAWKGCVCDRLCCWYFRGLGGGV